MPSTFLEENISSFDTYTGEIHSEVKRTIKKTNIEPTDEFIKVSKYLNLVFAYNEIPLSLVPISLLFAQYMEWKTNRIYLVKSVRNEICEMLNIKESRFKKLLSDCKKYNIIRPTQDRGVYVVNPFLYSTGGMVETKNLQASFDIDNDTYAMTVDQHNLITGDTIRKSVTNREDKKNLPRLEDNSL
jgi:hypothetical protein